eukprot:Pgem_evm1s8512
MCQGALQNSFEIFWKMVLYNQCPAIVMITNLVENLMLKCDKYWPDEGETFTFETLSVTNIKEELNEVFYRRTFVIKRGDREFTTSQFQYAVWPDMGIPTSVHEFCFFREQVNLVCSNENESIVVHCSAGIGRTGTYCAIDTELCRVSLALKTRNTKEMK